MDWRRLCAALVSVAVIGIAACDDADPTTVSSATYLLRRDGVAGHCLTGEDGIYSPCDCAQTHTIEVIATLDYPAEAPYPGLEGTIPMRFFTDCDAGFADYVGVAPDRSASQSGELRSIPVVPSEESWALGDHHVVCTVRSDIPWSGTVHELGDLSPSRQTPTQVALGSATGGYLMPARDACPVD